MFGIIIAIISGVAMSLQGVFNTRTGEKIGSWETNVIVQATGLILTLIITIFFGKGNFRALKDVNKLYLLGGVLGVIIIFTVMQSISSLGTTLAISTILIAQLLAAGLIDKFGLFGAEKLPFGIKEILGIVVMIVGVLIFKWKV